ELQFGATDADNQWKILYNQQSNTINIQKSTSTSQYIKYESGSFYHDSPDPAEGIFELWAVTGVEGGINTPQPVLRDLSDATLNPSDLTGEYVIQADTVSRFMGFDGASTVPATDEPYYTFNLVKNDDGSYLINAGDWGAVYSHDWNMQFAVQPVVSHTWIITVVDGDTVTIQRNDGTGNYVKYENGYFYQDADEDAMVKLRLRGTDSTPHITALSNAIDEANALLAAAGTKEYEEGALATFQQAVIAAQDIYDNIESFSESEVLQAASDLEAAIDAFNDAEIIPTDFSALTTLILEAESIETAALADDYEAGALATFSAAIDAAQLIADDDTATQEEVDEALAALQAAVVAFEAAQLPADLDLSGSLVFENTVVGETAILNFSITNTGIAELVVTDITLPIGFTANKDQATLAKGASTTVAVTFRPTEAKEYSGVVSVESSVGTSTLAVTGTGGSALAVFEDTVDLIFGPNPSQKYLNVDLASLKLQGSAMIVIQGLDGREYLQKEINSSNDHLSIDVSGFAKGIYILNLNSDKIDITTKFIKN
ncbi:MAG: choice-of-anchor D domain-containing protein, partial [Cyclobacteriaceae bacterium]